MAAGWSEAQIRAYRIADNKLALNAGWDDDLLRLELGELRGLDVDLGLLGFGTEELDALFAPPSVGLTDPDAAPDPPTRPASVLGDVWLLGRHRLVCGDCTDADTVAAALNGASPHLMVTDPPYGVDYDPSWRRNIRHRFGDVKSEGLVENDDRMDWQDAWALFSGDVAYVWHADRHASQVQSSIEAVGFEIRCQIIWAKQMAPITRGHYRWQHEPCWYCVRKRGTGHWVGDHNQTTLWQIKNMNTIGGRNTDVGDVPQHTHGTQKPVECMKRPIENNSSPGQAVYEPFSGSGTTIIAAEMTGRACHAIEISSAYVDVAVRRWQSFTGRGATLEGDGRMFDEIAEERVPYDADADSLGSYHDGVAAVGKRVKAGAAVPAFFLKQQQGA